MIANDHTTDSPARSIDANGRHIDPDLYWSIELGRFVEYTETINGVWITVDKIGGGTLGRSYDGDWTVSAGFTDFEGERIYDAETLRTGTAKSHKQVAKITATYVADLDGS